LERRLRGQLAQPIYEDSGRFWQLPDELMTKYGNAAVSAAHVTSD